MRILSDMQVMLDDLLIISFVKGLDEPRVLDRIVLTNE